MRLCRKWLFQARNGVEARMRVTHVASCHWPSSLIHTLTGPAKIKGNSLRPSLLPSSSWGRRSSSLEASCCRTWKDLDTIEFGHCGWTKMMGEVMAMGSSTMLGSASVVVSGPPAAAKKATATASLASPFLGSAMPTASTGLRTSRPVQSLAVKASLSAERPNFGTALSQAASTVGTGLSALALSALLNLGPGVAVSEASEFNVLSDGPPTENFVVDDANVLNRVTRSDLKRLLRDLEERKGYHINVITLRKLTSKADSFEFADTVLEKWYPTLEEGNNKGIVLLVTTQKEGAVTGGPSFTQAVGDKILEAVTAENLPVLATDEKYNEAIYSTAKRLVAAIDGAEDTGGPRFQDSKRESNFKTKEETESKRGQFSLVVGGLLVIAFVVPMAQYYAYVSKR